MHLYIAYKNYSSWSLRPWIAMKMASIEFEETVLPFYHSNALDKLAERYQIPAQVPVLVEDNTIIWDSLAIMETLAEQYPDRNLWPQESGLRVLARCAAAEMHSGFMTLRSTCPMNCRKQKRLTDEKLALIEGDLIRLAELWEHFDRANKPEGDFLCGKFGIVDAMYAPVMWRIVGYGLDVSPAFSKWATAMQALPAMQEWLAAAQDEEWTIEAYEAYGEDV
ncbi:glutathione S-transferase [Leucothrix pacifica]|uniref:Glutathione S-transferase n=1 Tax=Leucothrix pacifica TaxID=1247513 RepID=A0A317C314_9GAMM|nr:glutathione S-transferase [Leucothrix pacifica]PWQ92571.1 glutathione S-transferase [Leucothrix pacifica]